MTDTAEVWNVDANFKLPSRNMSSKMAMQMTGKELDPDQYMSCNPTKPFFGHSRQKTVFAERLHINIQQNCLLPGVFLDWFCSIATHKLQKCQYEMHDAW